MFTCSSCGYEANPDSAVACSLCGTKKASKEGGGSASKSSPAVAKTEPSGEDELAAAAKLVAEVGESGPKTAPSGKTARSGGPRGVEGGPRGVEVTHTGVLRLEQLPPDPGNPATALGALLGAIAGYGFSWSRNGHAPQSLVELVPMLAAAIGLGLLLRYTLALWLETNLTRSAKETFAGPVAMGVGLGFVVFSSFAFYQGSRSTASQDANRPPRPVGAKGEGLAERLILLTPWSGKMKTDKSYVLGLANKPELRIPLGPLTEKDFEAVQKATGLSEADVDRLASTDPAPAAMPVSPDFSRDLLLERLKDQYGVQKYSPRIASRVLELQPNLVRTRSGGAEELLRLPATVTVIGDLRTATPAGVPLWIVYALGLKHPDGGAQHEALVNQIIDRNRPD